jgi:hypothetical protein
MFGNEYTFPIVLLGYGAENHWDNWMNLRLSAKM